MALVIDGPEEVLFMTHLVVFYTHWLNNRPKDANAALMDALALHRAMGDERARELVGYIQKEIGELYDATEKEEGPA